MRPGGRCRDHGCSRVAGGRNPSPWPRHRLSHKNVSIRQRDPSSFPKDFHCDAQGRAALSQKLHAHPLSSAFRQNRRPRVRAGGAKPTSRAEVSPLRAVVIPPTGGNIVRADTATT
ncbi:hypothetical protein BGLA2_630008 [Burkholderia gladioli]|nr:hypothetical protein BGLA2_630008 [Burkholderia gladioli]